MDGIRPAGVGSTGVGDTVDGCVSDVARGVARVAVGAARGAVNAAAGIDPNAMMMDHYRALQVDNSSLRRQTQDMLNNIIGFTAVLERKNAIIEEQSRRILALESHIGKLEKKKK